MCSTLAQKCLRPHRSGPFNQLIFIAIEVFRVKQEQGYRPFLRVLLRIQALLPEHMRNLRERLLDARRAAGKATVTQDNGSESAARPRPPHVQRLQPSLRVSVGLAGALVRGPRVVPMRPEFGREVRRAEGMRKTSQADLAVVVGWRGFGALRQCRYRKGIDEVKVGELGC